MQSIRFFRISSRCRVQVRHFGQIRPIYSISTTVFHRKPRGPHESLRSTRSGGARARSVNGEAHMMSPHALPGQPQPSGHARSCATHFSSSRFTASAAISSGLRNSVTANILRTHDSVPAVPAVPAVPSIIATTTTAPSRRVTRRVAVAAPISCGYHTSTATTCLANTSKGTQFGEHHCFTQPPLHHHPPAAKFHSTRVISRMVHKGTNFVGVKYPQPTPAVIEKTRKNVFDSFSSKGKVASISGSSGGIGFDVAEAFAQAGADIAIWYNSRNPEKKVEYLKSEYGVRVKAYRVAIDNYDAVDAAIQEQIKDFGKIDIFVANAGVIWEGAPHLLDEADNKAWDKVMRINLDGVYYCAKAVGKHFRERGQGNLILTGSMSGHIINVPDTMAAYCTSKAAVIHLGKALALEWANFARVNVVSPGYIKTDMTEQKEAELINNWAPITPMGRMADSRELVGAYLYFASDASTYTTGTDLVVDGGYTAQ